MKWTLPLLAILAVICHETGIDITLSYFWFKDGQGFPGQNSFWLEKVFHKGGVNFVILLALVMIILMLRSFLKRKDEKHRQQFIELLFTFVSITLSVVLIKFLKNNTTLPCPWHVKEFGGPRDFQSILTLFSSNYPIGYCFPSGHASAGFGFLAWYFSKSLFLTSNSAPSLKYFLPGILLGGLFALTQQMRGAHFISHDLATIWLCLFIPWVLSLIIKPYVSRMEGQA